jgi:hypothetical protein
LKQKVPTPVAIGVVAVIVGAAGFLLWRHSSAQPTIEAGQSNAPTAAGRVMHPPGNKEAALKMYRGAK